MTLEVKLGSRILKQIPEVWRVAISSFALIMVIMVIAYWETIFNMVETWWRSDTYAHGFLIFPISLYLIWRRRGVLLEMTPQPVHWAWFLVLSASFVWLLAYLAEIQVVKQFMFIAMIPGVVWAMWGTSILMVMLFPLCYLFFAVPFGEFLIPYLQDVTAGFTVQSLRLTGIPVYLEGRYLSIPSGQFEVAKACSGLRYLIASIALGVLYAHLAYISLHKKLLFVAMAILVPVVANGIRAYGIVMIAHLSDYKLATGIDHLIYGWLFFGVVMFLLIWVGSFFSDQKPQSEVLPRENQINSSRKPEKNKLIKWVVTSLFIVASGPLAARWLDRPYENILSEPGLPQASDGWKGPQETDITWKPVFVGPTTERLVQYVNNGNTVYLYVAFYAEQKQGAELVSSENKHYDKNQWRRINDDLVFVQVGSTDKRIDIQETAIQSRHGKLLLWQWNQIGSLSTTSPLKAKLAEARSRLFRSQVPTAAIIIATKLDPEQKEAEHLLKEFLDKIYPNVVDLFTTKK